MPANPWELRADVTPLESAAQRWAELGGLMSRRGDEIVEAARRATEGWDAEAAESYDNHRRQVLMNLDRFTELTGQIASTLRSISSIISTSQKELDTAWSKVAMIPHDVVGESRYLVFRPSEDDDRGKVTSGQQETEEIRGRLQLLLDSESTRLRTARAEFTLVRTELKSLAGGFFPEGLEPGEEATGVGTVPPPSTTVLGTSQAGVTAASLAPIGPISVSMPDLTGISAVAPIAGLSASALAGRRGGARQNASGVPPIGGMGAGAMGARAGTMSRGMASGRSGPRRMPTPQLEGQAGSRSGSSAVGADDEDAATRAAREKEAAREAKRAALEEKRAERAARKAEREHDKEERERFDGVSMESVTVGSDAEGSDDVEDADGDPGVAAESTTETESERGASRR